MCGLQNSNWRSLHYVGGVWRVKKTPNAIVVMQLQSKKIGTCQQVRGFQKADWAQNTERPMRSKLKDPGPWRG
jgi:hypothetical protein